MVNYLKNIDVKNKRVILRVDYNVSLYDGVISSTKKIDKSLETIDYLINEGCKIVLLSHFGRVKTENDKETNSLKPVYDYLKSLGKYDILFSEVVMGDKLDNIVKNLKPGQIVLVENTRYMDLNGKLESNADPQLSMYWASLGDIYINDAFGTMHRNHASITGIPKYLPSAVGFLVEKELENLKCLIEEPPRPFVVVMGGAKLDDKINLIYSLIEKADYILLGGGIANTFLKAAGYNVGASLVSDSSLEVAKALMQEFPDKIKLPRDVVTMPTYSDTCELKLVENVGIDDVIGDIGSHALQNYKHFIDNAQTIFVNGTVGKYEELPFSNGTHEILNHIANSRAKKIIGGGDAGSAVKKFELNDKMDFVSTGGGATLSFIADKTLVGIQALEEKNEKNIY